MELRCSAAKFLHVQILCARYWQIMGAACRKNFHGVYGARNRNNPQLDVVFGRYPCLGKAESLVPLRARRSYIWSRVGNAGWRSLGRLESVSSKVKGEIKKMDQRATSPDSMTSITDLIQWSATRNHNEAD